MDNSQYNTESEEGALDQKPRKRGVLFWILFIIALVIPIIGLIPFIIFASSSKKRLKAIILVVVMIINIGTIVIFSLMQQGYFENYSEWRSLTSGNSPVAQALSICRKDSNCIKSIATAEENSEICKLLRSEYDLNDFEGDCYYSIALKTGDKSLCSLIQSSFSYKEECVAKFADAISDCEVFSYSWAQESCKLNYIVEHGSRNDCLQLDDYSQKGCLDNFPPQSVDDCNLYNEKGRSSCLSELVKSNKITSYQKLSIGDCGQFSIVNDIYDQYLCYETVIEISKQYKYCSYLGVTSGLLGAIDPRMESCYSRSWRLGKDNLCDKIENSNKKQECFNKTAYILNDSSLCQSYTCYFQLALKNKDLSLCEKSEYLKETCEAFLLIDASICDVDYYHFSNYSYYCEDIWEEYRGN